MVGWRQFLAVWIGTFSLFVAHANAADCPNGWDGNGNFCYKFVVRSVNVRGRNWENARAECLSYGGDLVSINNATEQAFILSQTKKYAQEHFWIGFNDQFNESVFVWSDKSNVTYKNWASKEPNDFGSGEDCVESYNSNAIWNDNDCKKEFSYICKRQKGVPMPTFTTMLPPTTPTYLHCPAGWEHFGTSCYKFSKIRKKWKDARTDCHKSGGYLIKIDDADEQNFITYRAQQMPVSLWIGLNDIALENTYIWEGDNSKANYTHWQSTEPNDHASVEDCIEVYQGWGAGFWNDDYCDGEKYYICEKPNGQNLCPLNWLTFGDFCYQFNVHFAQYLDWVRARDACTSTNGANLVSVTGADEQSFLLKELQDLKVTYSWIGLNDIGKEGIFLWSDRNFVTYKNWATNEPSTGYWAGIRDCVTLQVNSQNGTWSTSSCHTTRGYVCKKKRGYEQCESPLGMESKAIGDNQITASSIGNYNSPASQARLRLQPTNSSFGSWCSAQNKVGEFLQIDLGIVRQIQQIALQGRPSSSEYVMTFYVKYGNNGQDFNVYGQNATVPHKVLSGSRDSDSVGIAQLSEPIYSRFIRIYPLTWSNNICLRTEVYGCAYQDSSKDCNGYGWEKGSDDTCYQFNTDQRKLWSDARATCISRGGDLLSITSVKESTFIAGRLKSLSSSLYSLWLGLNDRDSNTRYYWSDGSPVRFTAWDASNPTDTQNKKACVEILASSGNWRDVSCGFYRPFICKKKLGSMHGDKTLVTGNWISGTDKYWPLNDIVDGIVLGTLPARVNGNISITDISQSLRPTLRFEASQSYVKVDSLTDCTVDPDKCNTGLTVSIVIKLDNASNTWVANTFIVDSIADEALRTSRGFSIFVTSGKLRVVVFTTLKSWTKDISLKTDVWQHVMFTWQANNGLVLYTDGTAQGPSDTGGKAHTSPHKHFSGEFTIGNRGYPRTGGFYARSLAVWHRTLSANQVKEIYDAEFGSCLTGWKDFGQYCYQFNVQPKPWAAANLACKAQSSELASVHSPVEQAHIRLETGPHGTDSFHWLGLHDTGVESMFEWTDGTAVQYTNWRSKQPDNWRNVEDCVHTVNWDGSMWNDIDCPNNMGYICKKKKEYVIGPSPTTAPQTIQFCEHTTGVLSCPASTKMVIQKANWGRTSSSVCGSINVTNCIFNVADILKQKCGEKNHCSLKASNWNFGKDPCWGVRKYLEVQFYCTAVVSFPVCPNGWQRSPDGNRCFKLFMDKKKWPDARDSCKKNGAELISIHNSIENAIQTSLMVSSWDGQDVWIGLTDYAQRGAYRWQDNSTVDFSSWLNGEPDDRTPRGSCVRATLKFGGGDWMYWKDSDCTETLAYVCAKYKNGFTPTTPPVTTAPSGVCPAGWSANGGACYRIESQQKTWISARDSCRALIAGADLVSIHSEVENAFVKNLTYSASAFSAWTGLNDRGLLFGHTWSDGSALKYTHWTPDQPDSQNGRQPCVEIYSTGDWNDIGCYSTKPYICKLPRPSKITAPPPTTKPATTPTQDPTICDPGWVLWNTMCYFFVNGSLSTQLSWHDARIVCHKSRAELVSILSEAENSFVTSRIRQYPVYTTWIGLNDLGDEGNYKWSDKSPLIFTKYGYKEPNDWGGQEDCIEIIKSGQWNDNHCERQRPFVCKKPNSTVFPSFTMGPPLGPPGPAPGSCNDSWVYYNRRCYKIVTDVSLSWQNARDVCKRGVNSSVYGDLVTLDDLYEQAFLTTQMMGKKGHFWIGLNDIHTEGTFYWTDNSPRRYTNWNSGEPANSYYKDCVEMVSVGTSGRWNVEACSYPHGYICEAAAHPPGPKRPFLTFGVRVFARWTNGLYYVGMIDKDKANTLHIKFDAGFQITHNRADLKAVVLDKTPPKSAVLNGTEVIAFKSNKNIYYPGVVGQIDHSKPKSYYILYGVGSKGWRSLNELRIFPNFTSGSCPKNYVQVSDMCYLVSYTKLTWKEAREACSSKDSGELISIHSQIHQAFMVQYMVNFAGTFWTGMYKEATSSTFTWSDNSLVDYTHWVKGQPSSPRAQRSCVQANNLVGSVGRWSDVDCSEEKAFICQINQGEPHVTPTLQGSCPHGWTMFEKHCYLFKEQKKLAWTTARQSCRKQGGGLLSIVSRQEMNFIVHHYREMPAVFLWTGLNDRSMEQHFEWSDGSPLTFENWRPKEPNDVSGRENCVEMASRNGSWNDLSCSIALGYICKSQLECSAALGMASGKISNSQLVVSSSTDGSHGAAAARINSSSAWCAKTADSEQSIQVDFINKTRITKIATQGYKQDGVEKFVRSFTLQFSDDKEAWSTYGEKGRDKIFFANTDANGLVFTSLSPPLDAQFVRILPTLWNTNICLRLEFYGCSFECERPLLGSSVKIKDDFFSASSTADDKHTAAQARPLGKAWCAKTNTNEWIQVNFPAQERNIVKITTWGGGSGGYVKIYSLAYVVNGSQWKKYTEGQRVRNFRGNSDAKSPVTHYLAQPITTKTLRIMPLSSSTAGVCLRFELYGCIHGCDAPLGLALGTVGDSSLTASSSLENHPPGAGRLMGPTGWCSVAGDMDPFFEINFGKIMRIRRIAIQGSGDGRDYTKTFTVQSLKDGDGDESWETYKEKGETKVFVGNSDNNTVVTKIFKNVIRAQFLKVLPKSFDDLACLRVEIYGCPSVVKPTKKPEKVISYKGAVKMTKLEWKDDYTNMNSPVALGLVSQLEAGIKDVFSDLDKASLAFKKIRVTRFRPGSVIADFLVSFFRDIAQESGVNVTSKLIAAVASGSLGQLEVDPNSFNLTIYDDNSGGEGTVAPQTGNRSSSGGLSAGAIAGIVIALLVLVGVVVGAAFWFKKRRGKLSMFEHKTFDNPVHFSSKAYDMEA